MTVPKSPEEKKAAKKEKLLKKKQKQMENQENSVKPEVSEPPAAATKEVSIPRLAKEEVPEENGKEFGKRSDRGTKCSH